MKNFSAIRSYGLLGILLLLGTGAAQGQSFGVDKLKCEQETRSASKPKRRVSVGSCTPRRGAPYRPLTRSSFRTRRKRSNAARATCGTAKKSLRRNRYSSLTQANRLKRQKNTTGASAYGTARKKRPRGRAPHLSQWDCYHRPTGREHGGSHSNPTSTA